MSLLRLFRAFLAPLLVVAFSPLATATPIADLSNLNCSLAFFGYTSDLKGTDSKNLLHYINPRTGKRTHSLSVTSIQLTPGRRDLIVAGHAYKDGRQTGTTGSVASYVATISVSSGLIKFVWDSFSPSYPEASGSQLATGKCTGYRLK